MTKFQKVSLLLLRLSLGGVFFYAGVSKLANPNWSAAGYLKNAKTFSGFYQWLTTDGVLPIVNFLNEWGLTLIGAALILGVTVRLSSYFGALMMFLYYFPALDFPKAGANGYIVDDHIVYIFAFAVLAAFAGTQIWALGKYCAKMRMCQNNPRLKFWLE